MARIRISRPASTEASNLSVVMTGWLQHMKVEELFVTCLTCQHLSELGTSCNLVPGDRPIPAHVVIKGCEAYADTHPEYNPLVDRRGPRGQIGGLYDNDVPF